MRTHVLAAGLTLLSVLVPAPSPVTAQMGGGYGGGSGGYEYDRPGTAGLMAQLQTARTHATNAMRSDVLRDARWHLGHVVNCLEGARGTNYDGSAGNPCQGQGNGIVPDLQAAARSDVRGATQALDLARQADRLALETIGLADLAQVKTGASKVADLLGTALSAIGRY